MEMKREADVKAHVKKALTNHGWFWWMPANNGYGVSGTSDILALKDGVFVAIETKFGRNRPTPQQRKFLANVEKQSGFAFVVNDSNYVHLDIWLAAFGTAATGVANKSGVSHEDGASMLNAMHVLMGYKAEAGA